MNENQNGQMNFNNSNANNFNAQPMPNQNPGVVNPTPVQNVQPMPEQNFVAPNPAPAQMPVQEPVQPQPVPAPNMIQPQPAPIQNNGPVNPAPVQMPAQPVQSQPMPAPNMVQSQPMYNQPMPAGNAAYVPNAPVKKQNKGILIGVIVVAVIAAVILLIVFLGNRYKKTLSCENHNLVLGIDLETKWDFYINDGEVAIKYTQIYNIDKFTSSDYSTAEQKDAFAKAKIEAGKSTCEAGNCTYSYTYTKGKKLKHSLKYSTSQTSSLLGSSLGGRTADEIYDALKTAVEGGSLDGLTYTCK